MKIIYVKQEGFEEADRHRHALLTELQEHLSEKSEVKEHTFREIQESLAREVSETPRFMFPGSEAPNGMIVELTDEDLKSSSPSSKHLG